MPKKATRYTQSFHVFRPFSIHSQTSSYLPYKIPKLASQHTYTPYSHHATSSVTQHQILVRLHPPFLIPLFHPHTHTHHLKARRLASRIPHRRDRTPAVCHNRACRKPTHRNRPANLARRASRKGVADAIEHTATLGLTHYVVAVVVDLAAERVDLGEGVADAGGEGVGVGFRV
jgi:hypothetical protein